LSSLFKKEHIPTEQFVQLVSVVNQEVTALVRLQMGEQNSSAVPAQPESGYRISPALACLTSILLAKANRLFLPQLLMEHHLKQPTLPSPRVRQTGAADVR